MWSAALGSSDLLLSHPIISPVSPMTIILISTLKHTFIEHELPRRSNNLNSDLLLGKFKALEGNNAQSHTLAQASGAQGERKVAAPAPFSAISSDFGPLSTASTASSSAIDYVVGKSNF